MANELPFDPKKAPDPKFEKAPDLIGTVEGWRAWKLHAAVPDFGIAPKLVSVSHSKYWWAPRKFAAAECYRCGEDVPGENCSCGFYSAKTLEHLMSMGYPGYNTETGWTVAIGQVANWGKVIEASQGWRSQKAYPVHLWVPYECWKLAKPLQAAYGVPVKLSQWLAPEMLVPKK